MCPKGTVESAAFDILVPGLIDKSVGSTEIVGTVCYTLNHNYLTKDQ